MRAISPNRQTGVIPHVFSCSGVLGHGGSRRESTLGATGPLEFGQDLVKVGGRLRRRAEWRNRGLQLLRLVALPLAAYDTWVVPLDAYASLVLLDDFRLIGVHGRLRSRAVISPVGRERFRYLARRNPAPTPFLQQALALATFEPGMYEVVESYSP